MHPNGGTQPNKRPYAPHRIPSHPGIRRPGMQPPLKRPTSHRSPVPSRVNPLIAPPVAPAETITDDQLDDLLGDFDVDAVIAASGRSQPLPTKQAPLTSQEAPTITKAVSSISSAATATLVANDPKQARSRPLNVRQNPSIGEQGISNVASDVPSPGGAKVNTEPKAAQTENPSCSAVDEAMIDNLLEGLDSSDFG